MLMSLVRSLYAVQKNVVKIAIHVQAGGKWPLATIS